MTDQVIALYYDCQAALVVSRFGQRQLTPAGVNLLRDLNYLKEVVTDSVTIDGPHHFTVQRYAVPMTHRYDLAIDSVGAELAELQPA